MLSLPKYKVFSVAEAYWPDPPSSTGENFLSFQSWFSKIVKISIPILAPPTVYRWPLGLYFIESQFILSLESSNRIAVNHFPAKNMNCHKLRIYQSIFRECFASLIIYDFAPSNRLAFALGLATIQADRSIDWILEDELESMPQ